MKILFVGSTRRGFEVLKALIHEGHGVCGVLSLKQFAHESENFEAPIRDLAQGKNIPLYETANLRSSEETLNFVGKCQPSLGIGVGIRVIVPNTLLNIPSLGFWAVHDSLLPNYRGFAPLNWAIVNGESRTGVSLFRMVAGFDEGPVILQRSVAIGKGESAQSICNKIIEASVSVIAEGLEKLKKDQLTEAFQNESAATYTCSRNPEDGEIDWSQPTEKIENLVRALGHPFPGAFTYLGYEKIAVLAARKSDDKRVFVGRVPGRVIAVDKSAETVSVLTGDGVLVLELVKLGDGSTLRPSEVIKSVRIRLGVDVQKLLDRLSLLESRVRSLESQLK